MPVESNIVGSVFMVWSHETDSCWRGLHSCGQTKCEIWPKAAYQSLYAYLRDNAVKKNIIIAALMCVVWLSKCYTSLSSACLFGLEVHEMSLKLKWNIRPGDDGIMDTYSHTGSVNSNEALMGMAAYF